MEEETSDESRVNARKGGTAGSWRDDWGRSNRNLMRSDLTQTEEFGSKRLFVLGGVGLRGVAYSRGGRSMALAASRASYGVADQFSKLHLGLKVYRRGASKGASQRRYPASRGGRMAATAGPGPLRATLPPLSLPGEDRSCVSTAGVRLFTPVLCSLKQYTEVAAGAAQGQLLAVEAVPASRARLRGERLRERAREGRSRPKPQPESESQLRHAIPNTLPSHLH